MCGNYTCACVLMYFSHNRDDHAKNISFPYDDIKDLWHLSPAGLLQHHCPQSKAVPGIVFQVPIDPTPGTGFVKRRGIVRHRFRVGHDFTEGVKVIRGVFPKDQAFGFESSYPHLRNSAAVLQTSHSGSHLFHIRYDPVGFLKTDCLMKPLAVRVVQFAVAGKFRTALSFRPAFTRGKQAAGVP